MSTDKIRNFCRSTSCGVSVKKGVKYCCMCNPKSLRERFEEKWEKSKKYPITHKIRVFSFMEKELTTRENEIIEMIDELDRAIGYKAASGELNENTAPAYNQALKDIKSKIRKL